MGANEFRRHLHTTYGIVVNEAEMAAILRRFGVAGKRNAIDVAKFSGTMKQRRPAATEAHAVSRGLPPKPRTPPTRAERGDVQPDEARAPWTLEALEHQIRVKISEKIQGEFTFQETMRLFADRPQNGTEPDNSRIAISQEQLQQKLRSKLGLKVRTQEMQLLFQKHDPHRSGKVNLKTLVEQLIPRDYGRGMIHWHLARSHVDTGYNGRAFNNARAPQAPIRVSDSLANADAFAMARYTPEELKRIISKKIHERCDKSGKTGYEFQRAFQMLGGARGGRGVTREVLRERLVLTFGMHVCEEDFERFFQLMDADGDGSIDEREFIAAIGDPDFRGTGQIWNETTSPEFNLLKSNAGPQGPSVRPIEHDDVWSLAAANWTVQELREQLTAKVNERLSGDGNCFPYQQIYKQFAEGGTSSSATISKARLVDRLHHRFHIIVTDEQADALLAEVPHNDNGEVALFDFVGFLLPGDADMQAHFDSRAEYDVFLKRPKGAPARDVRGEANNAESELRSLLEIEAQIKERLLLRANPEGNYTFKGVSLFMQDCCKFGTVLDEQGFRKLLRVKLDVKLSDEQAHELFRKFDRQQRGFLSTHDLTSALLPSDWDGSFHLTPKSDQTTAKGFELRELLFHLTGAYRNDAAVAGSSLYHEPGGGGMQPSHASAGGGGGGGVASGDTPVLQSGDLFMADGGTSGAAANKFAIHHSSGSRASSDTASSASIAPSVDGAAVMAATAVAKARRRRRRQQHPQQQMAEGGKESATGSATRGSRPLQPKPPQPPRQHAIVRGRHPQQSPVGSTSSSGTRLVHGRPHCDPRQQSASGQLPRTSPMHRQPSAKPPVGEGRLPQWGGGTKDRGEIREGEAAAHARAGAGQNWMGVSGSKAGLPQPPSTSSSLRRMPSSHHSGSTLGARRLVQRPVQFNGKFCDFASKGGNATTPRFP